MKNRPSAVFRQRVFSFIISFEKYENEDTVPAQLLSSREVSVAAEIIRTGGIGAMPTETVYGLAADATNGHAVARVFEAKRRPSFDPLIVHIADHSWVKRYAADIPETARRLMDAFWPGPLTIILKKKDIIPDIVTSGLDTVGLRMPDHPVALDLIRQSDRPIAAPSANLFSHTSPTSPGPVMDSLGQSIDFVIDGGECAVGLESTIISCAEDVPVLYRPGGISAERIESIIGSIRIAGATGDEAKAPGRSLRHYAPEKPMFLDDLRENHDWDRRMGLLCLCKDLEDEKHFEEIIELSPSGDLREAAHNLYAAIRSLDKMNVDAIIARSVPPRDIGIAVNDRLRRACLNGFSNV